MYCMLGCSDLHVVLLTYDLSVGPRQTRTNCRHGSADPLATTVIHQHVKSEGEHLVVLENMKFTTPWSYLVVDQESGHLR